MQQHQDLLEAILTKGRKKLDRTGVGTYSLFGPQMEFDLSEGFPLTTARQVFVRGTIKETLWFLAGDTSNETLVANNVNFWTRWAIKEDHVLKIDLSNFERAELYAKKFGRSTNEAVKELTLFKDEEAGHRFLDSHDIPRKRDKVIAKKGDLGPVYGEMWRRWPTRSGEKIDQITQLVENLRKLPWSRRHVISGWNPELLPDESKGHTANILNGKQCLPPCHTLFQFIVEPLTLDEQLSAYPGGHEAAMANMLKTVGDLGGANPEEFLKDYVTTSGIPDRMLSCKLHARSQDVPVGTVFNIVSYSLLVHMLCQQLGMKPGRYIHSMGDAHIYTNQIDGVKEQLTRVLRPLPTLEFTRKPDSIFDYNVEDFKIVGYQPGEKIDYPIAV